MTAHIHAELMKQYAEDAATTDEPWRLWEWSADGLIWSPMNGVATFFAPAIQYRRKPRTININGHKVPEPMRAAPKLGEKYWFPSWDSLSECFADWYDWEGDKGDLMRLSAGLCHPTKEAAEAHARALLSFTEVKA